MDLSKKLKQLENRLYFFILKRVKEESYAKDVLQNVHLKALENHSQLRDPQKWEAWLFQIARNETYNFFNREARYVQEFNVPALAHSVSQKHSPPDFCCFDKFIEELPFIYKEVTELIYFQGKTQKETAEILHISLANVKARVYRAKSILKSRFTECCQYELNEKGMLVGEGDCSVCEKEIG